MAFQKIWKRKQTTALLQVLSKVRYMHKNWSKETFNISTSNIHQKNTKDTSVAGTLTSYFTKSATRDETSSMEIKLCAFIAEHNLPISLSDDFIALLKST